MLTKGLCAACVLFAFALAGNAQETTTPAPVPLDQDEGDDILFIVKLEAKEIRVDVKPDIRVDFPGNKPRTTFWLTERRNLPETLEPGVTYRDAGLTLRISSRFTEIENLLREITSAMKAEDAGIAKSAVSTPKP